MVQPSDAPTAGMVAEAINYTGQQVGIGGCVGQVAQERRLVPGQDSGAQHGRTLLDTIVGYDPQDPFTVTASAAPVIGGYAEALDPTRPCRAFMEIYDSRQFHPLNDLFHGIAADPDTTDGDAEYLRLRLNQDHFRRLVLNIFAVHRLDFLVYPTVQVLPPARDQLAAEKYQALAFPTNTVIGSQAGLPALTIPAGLTEDGLPVGMELLGAPLAEAKMLQFARAWKTFRRPRQTPMLR